MKREFNRLDCALGLVAVLIGAVFWALIPIEVGYQRSAFGITGRFFPTLAAILVIACGSLLAVRAYLSPPPPPDERPAGLERPALRRLLPYATIVIAYVLLIDVLGYLVSTVAALGVLLYQTGTRSWPVLALVAVVVPLLLYYLFHEVMLVPLPEGLLL